MSGTISASPSRLAGAAPSFTGQAATVSELASGLKSSTSSLSGALAVDPLTGFGADLETLSGRVATSVNCFTDALHRFGQGLHISAESFSATDKQMASTFELIDQALSPYLGFDEPAQQPAPAPHHGRGFWGSLWHGISTGYHDFMNFRRRVQHDLNRIPIIGPLIQPNDPGMPGEPPPVEPPIEVPVVPVG